MNFIIYILIYGYEKDNKMNIKYLLSYFTLYLAYILIFFEMTGFAPYIIINFGCMDYRFIILYFMGIISFIIGDIIYRFINNFKAHDNNYNLKIK
jgi:hypothetical protein